MSGICLASVGFSSGRAQAGAKVTVYRCTDAAGNEQTEEITNFYVTTNLFVRYYNNKPLFFGSIAAVVVIAGVVIALAAGKKKKNDKEK